MNRRSLPALISSGFVSVEALPESIRLNYALRFTRAFWLALALTAAVWYLEHQPAFSLNVLMPLVIRLGGNVAILIGALQHSRGESRALQPPHRN
jgi:hypothetical protein